MIYEKTIGEKVVECLKSNPGKKFTARQIAEWIFINFRSDCEEKRKRSKRYLDDAALVQQLSAEINRDGAKIERDEQWIKIIEDGGRKYCYSERADEGEVAQDGAGQDVSSASQISSSEETKSSAQKERELYPKLAQYLWSTNIFPMRIEEGASSNRRGKNGNLWLHPDIVAMEDLGAEWGRDVRECVSAYSDRRASLWSFEVKTDLKPDNVRESFFQALSNSSWANFSYLVAQHIEGAGTMKELQMLSAAHGIGLIQLNVDNPSESKVLIPAHERAAVDWDMVNRLAEENGDFRKFVGRISRFCKTNDTQEWKQAIAAEWGLSEED